MQANRADLVSAWGTGVGVGFIGLMLAWIVGQRITAAIWGPPIGPTVALITAILVGILSTTIMGRRLARTARTNHVESSPASPL